MREVSDFSSHQDACAVCIGKEAKGTTHAGIVYHVRESDDSEKKYFFLHLTLSGKLENECKVDFVERRSHYRWSPFQMEDEKINFIRTILLRVAAANKVLDYGIIHSEDTIFDADDDFNVAYGGDATGHTCSTFIATLLEECDIQLIDYDSWPTDRQEDKNWAAIVLKFIETNLNKTNRLIRESEANKMVTMIITKNTLIEERNGLAGASHRLKKDMKKAFRRFRPEEIAGAAYEPYDTMPIPFERQDGQKGAKILGEELLILLPERPLKSRK